MTKDIFESLGLDKNPFSMAADTEGYFHTDATKQILDELAFGILSRKGFLLLTGEVGVGKTSLLYQLLKRLEDESLVTSWIFNTMLNKEELLLAIARDFSLDPPKTANVAQLIEILQTYLVEQNTQNKNCAIIVDEAHNLSLPALEALRMLSNLEAGGRKLVQILLVGQPELKARLDEPKLRQLRSRITIYRELAPFSPEETERYVNFKLSSAASQFRLARNPAKAVYRATLGNTRMINLIMERALYAAVAFGDRDLSMRAVRAAVAEIATCQVEVADRINAQRRRVQFWAGAAAAAVLLALALAPLVPVAQGRVSVAALAMDLLLPARAASVAPPLAVAEAGPANGTPAAAPAASAPEVPAAAGEMVASGGKEFRSALTQAVKNETNKEDAKKEDQPRGYPKAYRDFLEGVGLASMLDVFGSAVEGKNLNVFKRALPSQVQLLEFERLPSEGKAAYASFPWKQHAGGDPAWIVAWRPPLVITDFYYGYRSPDILQMQRMLKKLGYYWGADDGMVGPVTWRAINEFQKDMKLRRTMWPDPETVFWLVMVSG
ncbi:MAG: AAA family ATPase [Thermodesulfobacteriota bacterium]